MALEADPAAITAEKIMRPELVMAGEGQSVHETAELMRSKGVRRLAVINDQGGLVGIVSLDDLLTIIGEELTLLGRVIARERLQEQRSHR